MNPIRVALADDHEMVCLGLEMLLEEQADMVVVGQAGDGDAAIELCRRLRPDVLLLDLALPVRDGIEVLRQLRADDTVGAVLLLTTFARDEQIREALQAGARGVLFKDIDRARLAAAIRDASAGQIVLHPAAQAAVARSVSARAETRHEALTLRERAILAALAQGRSNKEIAAQLGLTVGTVKVYVTHVLAKLGVDDRTQAALYAHRNGLVNQS